MIFSYVVLNAPRIQDYDRRLEDFMVEGRDIITVNEWHRGVVRETPRSGFILLRNSPRAYQFLDVWAQSYKYYADIENPEQVRYGVPNRLR